MSYKKYIHKNGKLYGPYVYHSRRVNGKVVSDYHGVHKKKYSNLPIFFIFAVLILIITGLILNFNINKSISGQPTFGIDATYSEGESLQGVVRIGLKEGEFLPASTKYS